MNQIIIEPRDQYGAVVFHPINEAAKLFAQLAKTKTLTRDAIEIIESLGFEVAVKPRCPSELYQQEMESR